MRTLTIEAVVALEASSFGIGHADKLPWDLPVDMKRFRTLTTGHAVLMGTKTALTIGKALPKRRNYILTRSGEAPFEGVTSVASLQEAVNYYLALTENQEEVKLYICGGEEVYRATLPYLTGIHETVVYAEPKAPHDRFFPADELETYHGQRSIRPTFAWVDDGKDSAIRTYYSHRLFAKHPGPPLLSLPSDVKLAGAL